MAASLLSIELREIHLPLREPFKAAHGVVTTRRILLLHLTDANGISAWSECVALAEPSYTPETIDTAWLMLRDHIAPCILGQSTDPSDVHRRLSQSIRGHEMARAAVEMGAWALEAERRQIGLATLLGGTHNTVDSGVVIGLQPTLDDLVAKATQARDDGYQRIKLKIQPGNDLEPLKAVRDAVGPDVALIADANSAYSLDDAEHLANFDKLDLSMIEQPLGWDDLVQHSALQKRIATPICLDESLTSSARVREMLELGSGRIVNLKPGRVGSFTESLAIHELCQQRGIGLWCGGMLESGIGRAYNVALASLPGFDHPGDLSPSARYWERDIVTPEWTMDARGRVAVPRDIAGLGVDVDVDRIDDLTVRREVLQ